MGAQFAPDPAAGSGGGPYRGVDGRGSGGTSAARNRQRVEPGTARDSGRRRDGGDQLGRGTAEYSVERQPQHREIQQRDREEERQPRVFQGELHQFDQHLQKMSQVIYSGKLKEFIHLFNLTTTMMEMQMQKKQYYMVFEKEHCFVHSIRD